MMVCLHLCMYVCVCVYGGMSAFMRVCMYVFMAYVRGAIAV